MPETCVCDGRATLAQLQPGSILAITPTHSSDTLYPTTFRLTRFALPAMLAGIAPALMGMVDVAILGRLGDPAIIAAVGVAGTVFTVLIWAFAFLRYTTTGLVAQATSARDDGEKLVRGLRPLVAALVGAAGLLVLQVPILALGLALIAPEARVSELAGQYFHVRIWGSPFSLSLYALLAWVMGTGDSRSVLVAQVFMNVLNAVLTVTFVLGLGWGVTGAAWGSVIAEAATTAGVVALLLRRAPYSAWRAQWPKVFDAAAWRPLLAANADLVIRTLLISLSLAFLNERSARLGTLTLAANQVLLQAYLLVATLVDGVAMAAEVYTGRAVGARDARALRHVVTRSAYMALAWGAIIAVLVWAARDLYLPAMSVNPELVAEAGRFWGWQVLLPLAGVWAFMWDGVFFGATRTRPLRNSMIVAAAVFAATAVPLGSLYGNHGLWLALLIQLLTRVATLSLAWPKLAAAVGAGAPQAGEMAR